MIRWILAIVAVLAAALTAHLYVEGRPPQGRAQYVAMGSSFVAGPAITQAAADSPWFCARSKDNYAQQLARLRGLSLVDVTCGGATTRTVLEGGPLMLPPQVDAVTGETQLVTLTIGGNDIAYLGNLMAMGCDDATPWYVRAIGCKVRHTGTLESALRNMRDGMTRIVEEVRRRAPRAKVVLVTYQSVLPDSGTCARLGLTEAEVAQMRGVAEELAEVTRAVAAEQKTLLLDAAQVTHGHDVCAGQPWINAMHPPRGMLGAPLHPTIEGMTAVAAALHSSLGP